MASATPAAGPIRSKLTDAAKQIAAIAKIEQDAVQPQQRQVVQLQLVEHVDRAAAAMTVPTRVGRHGQPDEQD